MSRTVATAPGLLLFLVVLAAALLVEASETQCPHCLEDLLSSMDGTLQILPGLNISASSQTVLQNNGNGSEAGLQSAVERFLRSLTLHVAVYNEPVLGLLQAPDSNLVTGRSKKKKRFQFLSVYTVFALAFALLSALVGKALTISIVSLVVTLLVSRAVRGDLAAANSAANSAAPQVFDVVRRPQVQLQHTHSAEEVYEIPTAGGPGNTVSYVYASSPLRGRNVAATDPYSPYAPNAVHVSSTASESGSRHEQPAD